MNNKDIKSENNNIYISQEKRVNSTNYKRYIEFLKKDLTKISYIDLIENFRDDYIKYNKK